MSIAADRHPMNETVQCWTCGTDVQRSEIADRLEERRRVIGEKRQERPELQSEIESLRQAQRDLQSHRDRSLRKDRYRLRDSNQSSRLEIWSGPINLEYAASLYLQSTVKSFVGTENAFYFNCLYLINSYTVMYSPIIGWGQ